MGDVPTDCVAQFSVVVGEITRHIIGGEKEAWKAFFLLPRMVFALPRGGKEGRNLIHSYLALFCAGEWSALLKRQASHIGDSKGTVNKQKRAISLARVGYFSGAAKALVGGKLADPSHDDTYNKLIDLHPSLNACALLEEVFCPDRIFSAPLAELLMLLVGEVTILRFYLPRRRMISSNLPIESSVILS